MHGYFNDNLPSSFQIMFKSLAEPNRRKSYKLERVLDKNLETFPSAMFLKLWNAIEIDLKETKPAKIFKERVRRATKGGPGGQAPPSLKGGMPLP